MITFNGVSSTDFTDIKSIMQVKRPLHPGTNNRTLKVPGASGLYYFGKELKAQYLSFRMALQSTSIESRRATIRSIANWLDTDDVKILTMTDEPTLRFEAVLIDPINVQEFSNVGMTDVTFLIPDGCAYSVATNTVIPLAEIQTLYLGGATGGTYLLGDSNYEFPWTQYSTETWASLSVL